MVSFVVLFLSLFAALVYGQSGNSSEIATIKINGNAFFNSKTGDRFYIRGVDYQPGGSSNLTDPLADVQTCKRDIPVFQDLGINTIRVYTVDNSLDHTECMQMLQDAGIYLILDVNTPEASISRYDPACSYNADYLQSIFATVDVFAQYDNLLGFFAGNEVINMANNTFTATYVKAVVRDLKKYIKARNYREIPVGYSAADIESNRLLAAQYFNCGDDSDARIDMFGVNDYSWCGQSSFLTSGYSQKMKLYNGYSIPIFLSEFGCNQVAGSRPFQEIGSIYSTQMSSVFSGGLVYEYSNETNNYGLVQIDSPTEVTKLDDFNNLKNQYSQHPNPTGSGGYSTSNNYSTCPDYQAGIWEANNTLPEVPSAASAFFKSGAGAPMGTGFTTQQQCDSNGTDIIDFSSSDSSTTTSTSSSADASSTDSSSTSAPSSSTSSETSASPTSLIRSASSTRSSSSKGSGPVLEVPRGLQMIAQLFTMII